MRKNTKIVCLGGGIGTVNLIKGLKNYTENITVIVSMADDGGSAGRLRRFYNVPPPGDLVSCIAALSNADELLKKLLIYRFAGDRYGADNALPGQKVGNLMLVALTNITGDFGKAVSEMQRIFKTSGKILPSTNEGLSIWARTSVGEKVYREENIDLGRFTGKIEKLYIKPAKPAVSSEVKKAIAQADVIIGGPGDLYTTVLPVLLVPDILTLIKESKAKKIFVVNVANKAFETPDYAVEDFIQAITKHCRSKLFDTFIVNNNPRPKIPKKYNRQYDYVLVNGEARKNQNIFQADLVDESFPIYHKPEKLAKTISYLL